MSKILTRAAFETPSAGGAVGGSTNAVIHLLAIAGRVGIPLSLDDWDRLGRDVPTIVDLMPSGRFMMEDFYYAGGLPPVLRELAERGLLHKDTLTVNGRTQWENFARRRFKTEVIRRSSGRSSRRGIAVLRGPGAIRRRLKTSAA